MVTLGETFLLLHHHSDLGLHRIPLLQTDLDRESVKQGREKKWKKVKASVQLKAQL